MDEDLIYAELAEADAALGLQDAGDYMQHLEDSGILEEHYDYYQNLLDDLA